MKKEKSPKAALVTEEFVLEKFVDLLNDEEANWTVKVKGLELLGKYLSMFQEQKKIDINYRQLITGASLEDLKRLAGDSYGEVSEMVNDSGEYHISGSRADPNRLIQGTGKSEHEGYSKD
jgi:hypothetical protein